MSNFENVTVDRKANIYFAGRVTSRTITLPSGETKTLGIMMPGEYHFGTEKKELMEIQAGNVEVLLPGETEWQTFGPDSSFEVPAKSSFDIKVASITDYCCSYLD
jgi:purine/pyrimidine-nucleoside phosphorylase